MWRPCVRPVAHCHAHCLRCPQKNHLSGLKRRLLKLVFWNETHMAEVRRECQALVRRNRYKAGSGTAAYDVVAGERGTRERIQVRLFIDHC